MADTMYSTNAIRKRKKRVDKSRIAFILTMITYPLLLFLVFWVTTNVTSFVLAFTKSDLYGNTTFVWFDNFKEFLTKLFSDTDAVGQSMINSVKMYAINLCISLPLYIIFSYLVFKKCFLHKTIRVMVMLPQVISGFVVSMLFATFITGTNSPMSYLFEKMGILDGRGAPLELLYSDGYKYALGTMIFYGIWISFGMNMIVYPNAMKEIDAGILESAQIDGVRNMWQELWYIILPLIFPTLETFLVTGVATMLTDQGVVLTFFPGGIPPGANVSNMGYYYFIQVQSGNSGSYNLMSAGGLILTIIVAPITIGLRYVLDKYGPSTEK